MADPTTPAPTQPDRPDETLAPLLTMKQEDNWASCEIDQDLVVELAAQRAALIEERRLSAEKDAKLAVEVQELIRETARRVDAEGRLAEQHERIQRYVKLCQDCLDERDAANTKVAAQSATLARLTEERDNWRNWWHEADKTHRAREQEIATLKAELDNYSSRLLDYVDAHAAGEQRIARLTEALTTILRGFDSGVFIRDISRYDDPSWAIKLFPYIQALAKAQSALADAPDATPEPR